MSEIRHMLHVEGIDIPFAMSLWDRMAFMLGIHNFLLMVPVEHDNAVSLTMS